MCITKTEAWAYAGVNYTTEKEAVKAALTDMGTRIVKEFHSQPFDGLMKFGMEITPLRERYLELLDMELHAGKAPSENATGEPKSAGTRSGGKLTMIELDNANHTRSCRARLTGYSKDCTCAGDER